MKALESQNAFKDICGFLEIIGAIDCTHVVISKPKVGSDDYYHFKSGDYTLNYQAVVDSNKKILDLYLGMPGSMHDVCVMRRSSLYHVAQNENLLDQRTGIDRFSPYLLGNSGYPLLPWFMVPLLTSTSASLSPHCLGVYLQSPPQVWSLFSRECLWHSQAKLEGITRKV